MNRYDTPPAARRPTVTTGPHDAANVALCRHARTPRDDCADRSEPSDWYERIELRDIADPDESIDANEPTPPKQQAEPTLPMESTDPILPTERIEPSQPIQSNEFRDQSESLDVGVRAITTI
jgi:hypothetical protein